MVTIEPVGEVVARLGEGPAWDAATDSLLWVDIDGGIVHRTAPDSEETLSTEVGAPVSAVIPSASGEPVLLRRDRAVRGDEVLAVLDDLPAEMRFNDAKCDPQGRLWAGTMNMNRDPGTATLHRLDGDRFTPMVTGVTVSNGLGWSPDSRTMYYADTPTLRVDAFDFDPATGAISGRRVFADLAGAPGRPDGLAVDDEGCVWVAVVRGGLLRRYLPSGEVAADYPLPVSTPTSCAFVGSTLFVTTARDLLPPAERDAQPLAGRLLRLRPGVSGPPATPYRG